MTPNALMPVSRCARRVSLKALSLCGLLAWQLAEGPSVWAADPLPGVARDPTRWPAALQAPAASAANAAANTLPTPQQIMIVDGKAWLVIGSRRYGVNDKLGDARIQRIEESAVWLRDAQGVHRLPLFEGVQVRHQTPSKRPDGTKNQNRDTP